MRLNGTPNDTPIEWATSAWSAQELNVHDQGLKEKTEHGRVLTNSLQPGNTNANLTFDHHNMPKVTFGFAFPGSQAVCTKLPVACFLRVARARTM